MLARMWGKGTLVHCWWEYKSVQPLWKTVWRFLKKGKIELPYDPAIPLLGIYPKKTKTLIQKDTCTPIIIIALYTIAKIWKQHKCPSTNEYIYYKNIYTRRKKWITSKCKSLHYLINSTSVLNTTVLKTNKQTNKTIE